MSPEEIQKQINILEKDETLQNMIAQANARYILYNTSESRDNFPLYTIEDDKLNLLAFQYITLGCRLIENDFLHQGIVPLEKGASILEYVHGSQQVETHLGTYHSLIAAMSYYVCFQYSKSFILIRKIEASTPVAKLITLFLSREYTALQNEIYSMAVDERYTDEYLSKQEIGFESNSKIYEFTIARALNNFVHYFYSGDIELLSTAKSLLRSLKEIVEIQAEPDVWWVVRLLILITDGFAESSLWNTLSTYFNTTEGLVNKYIHSLTFKKNGVYELFITQRNALPTVLGNDDQGAIVSIPTSSGKTRIAEIAIVNCINEDIENKVLFIAPFRSLAYEVENSLDEIFSNIGIVTSHLYGGSLFSKLDEKVVEESNVIIATPEKAKAMLRGNSEILNQIKLVVVDEGHLLGGNKRLIVNEMFIEELRFHVKKNNGRFLLLSAVLPNAKDLSNWLTESDENVFTSTWRPSDERLGILEWNGNNVNLNWRSTDTERNSFNNNFIVREELPWQKRQRVAKFFPDSKNQAIANTAYRMSQFGPVLIFVGRKNSVFTIAREYEKCIKEPFIYKSDHDWKAFELACTEAYGADCEWLHFARLGVLCHNADLLADVRLPLERLMYKERPLVIIATSTLGQGVNLGVSSVIFSTLSQGNQGKLTHRDFWNIAGRAGRAFVDHEGKILVALETAGKNNLVLTGERDAIVEYFDKSKIDKAISGCLILIRAFKLTAQENGVNFDRLIELIADNNFAEIDSDTKGIEALLDYIDDSLLALHSENNDETDSLEWSDDHFRTSLAYLQAEHEKDIDSEEIISFFKARIKGIVKKVGTDSEKWKSIATSGIPLNSDLQIEDKMDELTDIVERYLIIGDSIDDKVTLLKNIEDAISDVNVIREESHISNDMDLIRQQWLRAEPLSEISKLNNAIAIVTKYYSFTLPWILNGIAKKMRLRELEDEAEVLEELAILAELGMPDLKSVKVYQAGIRSRSSAHEIGSLLDDDIIGNSLKACKRSLIGDAATLKMQLSAEAGQWIDLLARYSSSDKKRSVDVPDLVYDFAVDKANKLIAKNINGKQFLLSPDFNFIEEQVESDIDFSSVNDIEGVEFVHNQDSGLYEVIITNPNIVRKN